MTAPTARPAAPPTCGSLFSGGRGTDLGLAAAGYASAWTVERDPVINAVGAANVPAGRCYVADVGDVDPRRLEPVDLLWASPPCQGASVARSPHLPRHADADAGDLLIPYLAALRPRAFVLENVPRYRREPSFARIVAALHDLGYMTHATVVNAADFGVAQTRRRLILRAVRGGLVPHLPPPVPWVGWYAAIEDLIPDLPASAFAPWQLARLPSSIEDSTLFVAQESTDHQGGSYGTPGRAAGKPAHCLTGRSPGWYKAFLVSGQNANQEWGKGYRDGDESAPAIASSMAARPAHMPRALLVGGGNTQVAVVDSKAREGDAPAFTTTASSVRDRAFIVDGKLGNMSTSATIRDGGDPMFTIPASVTKHAIRAWLAQGRVVAMTPRALARFQSVPDSYELPASRGLAGTVLGNMVPPLLSQRIGEGLREVTG